MRLYLIRHGATKGNLEHRYVGATDEALLPESAEKLALTKMPAAEKVLVSPLKRCRETAEILYPGRTQNVVEAFRECDFGAFEYKNYTDLNGNQAYQQFIDTMGKSGFPGGENRDAFQKRCVRAFEEIMRFETEDDKNLAMVVHGGTIMALLDHYSMPHKDYYEWQTGNGQGFAVNIVKNDRGSLYFTKIHKLK